MDGFDVEPIASGGKGEIIHPDHYSISCEAMYLNSGNKIRIETHKMDKLARFNFARQKITLRIPQRIQVSLTGNSSNERSVISHRDKIR